MEVAAARLNCLRLCLHWSGIAASRTTCTAGNSNPRRSNNPECDKNLDEREAGSCVSHDQLFPEGKDYTGVNAAGGRLPCASGHPSTRANYLISNGCFNKTAGRAAVLPSGLKLAASTCTVYDPFGNPPNRFVTPVHLVRPVTSASVCRRAGVARPSRYRIEGEYLDPDHFVRIIHPCISPYPPCRCTDLRRHAAGMAFG